MILIDTSQFVIASATNSGAKLNAPEQEQKNLIKHMFFNTIRICNRNFSPKYGNIVFATDSRNYWRKNIFPYYKANRKKKREDSLFNWELIFEVRDELISDIKQFFPYPVIGIDGAEADDIIAVLTKYVTAHHLICSSDKDLGLLQTELVQQYCPKKKQFLPMSDNIEEMLLLHIINGDRVDGIPNIRSPSNSFVDGIRQRSITKDYVENCIEVGIPIEDVDRYMENKTLIDHNCIPNNIIASIQSAWDNRIENGYSQLFNYFARNGYRHLLADVGDF